MSKQVECMLSKRQIECLYYLVKGMTAKETARIIGISHRTVECYLDNIKTKLNCSSRVELIEKALRVKIIREKLLIDSM